MSVVFSFVREANGNITCIPCSQPGGSDGKESACKAGDLGLTPGLGRCPGEGNGNPLQDSCLENSMDRGAWLAAVLGVAKSQIQLWQTLSLSCCKQKEFNNSSLEKNLEGCDKGQDKTVETWWPGTYPWDWDKRSRERQGRLHKCLLCFLWKCHHGLKI